jgi:GxxExxY protein
LNAVETIAKSDRRIVVPDNVETLATKAVHAAFEVHRELGPGLLDSVYEAAMVRELTRLGVACERQIPVSVTYKDESLGLGFRADIIIEGRLLIELKAVDDLPSVSKAQVITYLKLLNLPLGLLINFNSELIKYGIHRVLNTRYRSP